MALRCIRPLSTVQADSSLTGTGTFLPPRQFNLNSSLITNYPSAQRIANADRQGIQPWKASCTSKEDVVG